MTETLAPTHFIHRYFTPENRLAEVICALVMVMSFTATTSATFEDTTPNALLIAVLGCNIAWGLVDGTTYVLGNLLNRGVRARLVAALKNNSRDSAALHVIQERLDVALGPVLTPEQQEQIGKWIVEGITRIQPEPTGLRKEDLLTGLACFLLVLGVTLPILLPFILIENDFTALRVANGLMLAMLFAAGVKWAKFAGISRWKTGLSLLGVGIVLVAVTVLLGG
jgi:VIT1/CCC1 family predicted Fe2+/Mn2+ transporter